MSGGRLRRWARALKRDAVAVYLAARDPRTPWSARLVALAVAAYALSPIDLIPDAIPVLGLLDDLILVPAGIWLALRLIPADVLARARERAGSAGRIPIGRAGAAAIVALWILALAGMGWWLVRLTG